MSIEKINDTQFSETLEPVVVVKSLDDLQSELANAQQGLQNNQDGVVYFTQYISDLEAKIDEVKNLGIKTEAEALSDNQVVPE